MHLYFGNRIFWKCNVSACKKSITLRIGTWFENSRLPFTTAVRFIYFWSKELSSIKFCQHEIEICNNTTVDWNSYMREVAVHALLQRNKKAIGGPGKIVEIDESLFTKRKNNCGRVLPPQWIFGGICRENGEVFLVQVDDRSQETLTEKIKEFIVPGSIIYSDSWSGYSTERLFEAGYEHLKVNHSKNFVDPDTGVHTQKVERMWGSAKWRNKRHRGTARHHLECYLAEFAWRKHVAGEDVFKAVLQEIQAFMPPVVNMSK
uniref:DDE_Tnp_IS1595 domain-containing protein n=1 Tax=Panagrellus redivivus TaxID=6233 RepID=A0A7E4V154_PANRE